MFRRRGFLELGVFLVISLGLTFAVVGAIDLLEPLWPVGLRRFLRNPGSPLPILVASVFIAMVIVKAWSRSDPHPPR